MEALEYINKGHTKGEVVIKIKKSLSTNLIKYPMFAVNHYRLLKNKRISDNKGPMGFF